MIVASEGSPIKQGRQADEQHQPGYAPQYCQLGECFFGIRGFHSSVRILELLSCTVPLLEND